MGLRQSRVRDLDDKDWIATVSDFGLTCSGPVGDKVRTIGVIEVCPVSFYKDWIRQNSSGGSGGIQLIIKIGNSHSKICFEQRVYPRTVNPPA